MKRALFAALLLLAACAPQIVRAPERILYQATAGALTITTDAPLRYGFFSLIGARLSSPYCVDECKPDASGLIYMRLPEKPSYGTHVLLGRYEGTPTGGVAAVVVEGEKDGLEAGLVTLEAQ